MVSNKYITTMLTVREVAHILNIHENTVRRWSNCGILRALRIGPRGDRRFEQRQIGRVLSELHSNNGDERKVKLG